jgi:hypothetical protein
MIIKQGEMGIEAISYFDDEYIMNFNSENTIRNFESYPIPNLVIYHGMNLKGSITLFDEVSYYKDGKKNVFNILRVGEYAFLIHDRAKAEKVHVIIAGIISNPNADRDIDNMLKAAEELFFQ